MEIKKIYIGGNREEIDKATGVHTPNFIDTVKRSDLIFTPELLVEKLFKGSSQEYNTWLMKHKLHPSQINYHDINQKEQLLKKLRAYTLRLLDEAKTDSMFSNELGNIIVPKWIESFDTLENHIYDLSDFSKVEFIKISDAFKKRFTTYSPFAFLMIDETNQQLKVIESHKVLLLLDEKLPMGNKRGTPVGQEPEKLYQNLFTTIGYKGKGELTEGLNYHRTNFKNFNFNVNIETRLLNDIIYDTLGYDREKTQVAFLFGAYGKKLYFESDIKGTERKQEELEALAIAEGATTAIEKSLHKERQGSIPVDQTSTEVKKRIEHPKVSEEKKSLTNEEDVQPVTEVIKERKKLTIREVEPKKEESTQPIDSTLVAFEKEMFRKQQGYAELAKEKISEALTNREQYIKEFHTFLNKGMGVSDALNKFSERYANNPYIKGIIETSIAGELQLQALKDKGIEELNHTVNVLRSEKQGLKKDLGDKETELASLNQSMESLIVAHNKQLEEIEVKITKLVQENMSLVESNENQSEMIAELEKLIVQYEQTLKQRDSEISEKANEINTLKETVIENEKAYTLTLEGKDKELTQKENQIDVLEKEKKVFIAEMKKKTEELEVVNGSLIESRREIESKDKELTQKDEQIKVFIEGMKEKTEELEVVNGSLRESKREIESLEQEKRSLARKIDNSEAESKHYLRQIEQLKEENNLSLSTVDLLKESNKQLEQQLSGLVKNRELLEKKNSEQEEINEALSKEVALLKEELTKVKEKKSIEEALGNKESMHDNGFIAKRK